MKFFVSKIEILFNLKCAYLSKSDHSDLIRNFLYVIDRPRLVKKGKKYHIREHAKFKGFVELNTFY